MSKASSGCSSGRSGDRVPHMRRRRRLRRGRLGLAVLVVVIVLAGWLAARERRGASTELPAEPASIQVHLPVELVIDNIVVLAAASSRDKSFVCEEPPSGLGKPGRYLARGECIAKILGTAEWGLGKFEYYPGQTELSPIPRQQWPVGIISVGTSWHLQSLAKYWESKVAWCERWDTPLWLYVGELESTVLRYAAQEKLGVWWHQRKNLYPTSTMINAWSKPLVALDALQQEVFEFVLVLDADAWIGNPLLSPMTLLPSPDLDNVHIVALKKSPLQSHLRFSNWFFGLRRSSISIAFIRAWIAPPSPCDCWIDQAPMWLTLLRLLAVHHNDSSVAHACDALWSPSAKRRAMVELEKKGCLERDSLPRQSTPEEPCPPYCADVCSWTRPGPSLCLCGGFSCFDTAILSLKPEFTEQGLVIAPLMLWRKPEALAPMNEEFVFLRHKKDALF